VVVPQNIGVGMSATDRVLGRATAHGRRRNVSGAMPIH
jgi:hypothetical protein